ncbi:ribosome biogenesis GTP-binding protein YihA/YsxC [Ilumatobacter sp.]|uniref:ribosome biogenesis GTP-binding protein YihA/YsxC n=1 Tax=Ilumatobacter sp. TaxID=1967498 RepID=UPI003B52EA49
MSPPLQLTFVESASRASTLPESPAEVAFVGRSNVGKSSLINALANRRQLARVSNTPGRTQLINLFRLDDGRRGGGAPVAGDEPVGTVVDLPGYGYAKAAKKVREGWGPMIEGYLLEREELAMVFVLVDGAIGPTSLDTSMLDWLRYNTVPHTVVATKLDKVKSSKRATRRRELAAGCRLDPDDVVWTSTSSGDGIDRVRSAVRMHLVD